MLTNLKKLISFYKPYKGLFAADLSCSLIAAALSRGAGYITDQVLTGDSCTARGKILGVGRGLLVSGADPGLLQLLYGLPGPRHGRLYGTGHPGELSFRLYFPIRRSPGRGSHVPDHQRLPGLGGIRLPRGRAGQLHQISGGVPDPLEHPLADDPGDSLFPALQCRGTPCYFDENGRSLRQSRETGRDQRPSRGFPLLHPHGPILCRRGIKRKEIPPSQT